MSTSTRPGYIVSTRLGNVEATPTDANHIYVSFGSSYDKGQALTVRGVTYHGSAHFYRYNNGEWHIGQEYADKERTRLANDYDKRTALHLSRAQLGGRMFDVSEHARTTLHGVLTAAIADMFGWVHSGEGIVALANAAELQRQEDLADVEAEIAETEAEITKLKLKLAKLRGE